MQKILFILSAGMGTRLGSLTQNKPKALVEYQGVSLLERVLRRAEGEGFSEVVINIHHFADQVEDFLKQRTQRGPCKLRIHISDERALLMDTGGALTHALPLLEKAHYVMIHNVDVLSNLNWQRACSDFEERGEEAMMVTQHRLTERYLLFEPKSLRLQGWYHLKTEEVKPVSPGVPPQELLACSERMAFNGIHLIKPALIAQWKKTYGERPFSVMDAYLQSARNNTIKAYKPQEPFLWRDMGKISAFETDFPEV